MKPGPLVTGESGGGGETQKTNVIKRTTTRPAAGPVCGTMGEYAIETHIPVYFNSTNMLYG